MPSSEAPSADSRPRVLLVEDSELVRETTIEFLDELGYGVVAVETAEEALTTLQSDRFDIVFTDISLPGMSGIVLVKKALESNPGQRFVISSGYGSDLAKHGFGPGVVLLPKPYDLSRLETTLSDLLGSGAA